MLHTIKNGLSTKLFVFILIAVSLFSACEKDEVSVDTVQLEVFGPSPVLRGGEIKFIGKNLDKITSVQLAQGLEITDIQRVSSEEIRIQIPQDAVPGPITLKYPDGEIFTKTPLTFSEPIVINKVSPAVVKAGDIMTIEGDYLNLINEVIFTQDAVVAFADFKSRTRGKIEVVVPKEAKSGKISISNGAEIPIVIFSETELNVTLPTLTSVAPNPVKPEQELTIKGSNFQLVESILFSDNITSSTFAVNESHTEIKVSVPEMVKEGVIKLIAFSGVEVESTVLKLISPAITEVTPNPIKNGTSLKIEGTHLDLVTSIVFAGDVEGSITEKKENSILVTVPLNAKSGVMTLNTNSGKTVTAQVNTILPTISSFSPTTLMAGEQITITGTNLDLVRSIVFGGNQIVSNVVANSPTTIRINIPMTAESGVIKLITSNSSEVISSTSLTVTSPNIPVITKITSPVKPGDLLRIEGTKLHLVESIYFQNNVKATQYVSRSETLIQVYVPANAAKGNVTLRLMTFDNKEVVSTTFVISGTDPVVDQSYVFYDFDGKNSWWGSFGAMENQSSLSMSGSYFRINQNLPAGWADFFWRNSQNDFKTSGVTVAEWAIKMDVNVLGNTTQEFKFRLNGSDGDFWAIIPGFQNKGGWYTVTIPLTNFKDGNGTGTKQLPSVQNITQDFGLATNGEAGFVNMCIDNVRFEKIK
ncbi:glycan-binding surface protein [Sphingobacterium bovistauri]|uniref:Surface glycan-binding protein B xyloglucan binding domain-containing protein n=1 Tax=Sphingobacterium bovistauri TaxID=2781959 RepID=A0ABS7Z4Q9_9SPHI|nr:glycan-binding surface protein [Sphingobacterium bovistauri]MCA5005158.1 hypothetical protein [Sphingobacterium bovistauri]